MNEMNLTRQLAKILFAECSGCDYNEYLKINNFINIQNDTTCDSIYDR